MSAKCLPWPWTFIIQVFAVGFILSLEWCLSLSLHLSTVRPCLDAASFSHWRQSGSEIIATSSRNPSKMVDGSGFLQNWSVELFGHQSATKGSQKTPPGSALEPAKSSKRLFLNLRESSKISFEIASNLKWKGYIIISVLKPCVDTEVTHYVQFGLTVGRRSRKIVRVRDFWKHCSQLSEITICKTNVDDYSFSKRFEYRIKFISFLAASFMPRT